MDANGTRGVAGLVPSVDREIPLTFSDDELITELRRLRARLRRDPENVKFAFQRRMGRKSMTTALLKDVEEAAVTIIAAHWRAREVRVGHASLACCGSTPGRCCVGEPAGRPHTMV
jgi:hypothetical protein